MGFAKVLATCILRADCRKTYHQGAHDVLETRIAKLAQKLPEVYGRIRAVAPTATLVVTDYPRIFTPRRDKLNCAALVGALSPAEARYLNARAASLDAAIAAAAQDPGVVFVEVRDALARHELSCRGGAWVHATRLPLRYSFHRTARGQQAIAAAVSRVLQQRGIRP